MKAKLEVTLITYMDVPAIDPPSTADFVCEKYTCVDDIIKKAILPEIEEATKKGSCTCYRAKIKFLGYVQ